MILWKWDFRRHEYRPFGVPNDRKVRAWCADLSEKIDCANCGRSITFGESLTSLTIHTHMGIGFAVCKACQDEEIKEKMEMNGEEITVTREEAAAVLQNEMEDHEEAKNMAIDALLGGQWCDAQHELPPEGELVLVIANAKIGHINLRDAHELAAYYPDEGIWELEMYPDCEDAQVRWWMPLPEAPVVDEQ